MKANERLIPWRQLNNEMVEMFEALESGDVMAIRAMLQGLVPEYRPEAHSVDWVQMARVAREQVEEKAL